MSGAPAARLPSTGRTASSVGGIAVAGGMRHEDPSHIDRGDPAGRVDRMRRGQLEQSRWRSSGYDRNRRRGGHRRRDRRHDRHFGRSYPAAAEVFGRSGRRLPTHQQLPVSVQRRRPHRQVLLRYRRDDHFDVDGNLQRTRTRRGHVGRGGTACGWDTLLLGRKALFLCAGLRTHRDNLEEWRRVGGRARRSIADHQRHLRGQR